MPQTFGRQYHLYVCMREIPAEKRRAGNAVPRMLHWTNGLRCDKGGGGGGCWNAARVAMAALVLLARRSRRCIGRSGSRAIKYEE